MCILKICKGVIACVEMSTLSEVYMNMPVKQTLIILSFCKSIPFKIKGEKFMPLDIVQWVKMVHEA